MLSQVEQEGDNCMFWGWRQAFEWPTVDDFVVAKVSKSFTVPQVLLARPNRSANCEISAGIVAEPSLRPWLGPSGSTGDWST